LELDELMNNFLVIGAGVSGLTAAFELAKHQPTTVVDRLPLIGGTHSSYEDEYANSLKGECDASGVSFLLGNTALRWSQSNQLLIVGPEGIRWLVGSHLVYAGGIRPSTQAELGILGQRLAGVFACTVAKHFLETGIKLGDRVVVLGNGNSAEHIGKLLFIQGSHVIMLPMDDDGSRPNFANEWWPLWTPRSFYGQGRVNSVEISKDGMKERIKCDAVILAARMKPLRNIDGAIFDSESHAVTFAQLTSDSTTLDQRSTHASQVVKQLLLELRSKKHES
jgi:thioredoxin reductase